MLRRNAANPKMGSPGAAAAAGDVQLRPPSELVKTVLPEPVS